MESIIKEDNIILYPKFQNTNENCGAIRGQSFEHWCIYNNKQDILNRWDYALNDCKPYEITYNTSKKYYFICENGLHKSELKSIKAYINNYNKHGKSNILNCNQCTSLAQNLLNIHGDNGINDYWSDKNNISPWDISIFSGKFVFIKCNNRKHNDYYRKVSEATNAEYCCPECQYSKGEKAIEKYLIKNSIFYIQQKGFDGLLGLRNGKLSYDFYLPQFNLLIEYQGEQHEKLNKYFYKSKKDFERQQEHDKRKRDYAIAHNMKLLEIWYYDFDNIEESLEQIVNSLTKLL
jgi:hypothetical protein